MDETKKYRITLADGTNFLAAPDGAGNFIADEYIENEYFSTDNISEVIISDGNTVIGTLINQVLRTYYPVENGTFFRLSDMTDLEKIEADYNAKLDYIACMTGVDLDE